MYNQQGWLTGINELPNSVLPSNGDPCIVGSGGSSQPEPTGTNTDALDIFKLGIGYDATISSLLVPINRNGNITNIKFHHAGDKMTQAYSYQYDHLNRVIYSGHGQIEPLTYLSSNNYTESFNYDVRGNITKLNRKGMVQKNHIAERCYQTGTIDDLTYAYEANSNKLNTIVDKAPCLDQITLPDTILRDVIYAALNVIHVQRTTVKPNVNMQLISQEVKVHQDMKIQSEGAEKAYIEVKNTGCQDAKYTQGFNQQSASGQYLYDASGNLTFDPHKKITFQYNHLNLPYRIIGVEADTLDISYMQLMEACSAEAIAKAESNNTNGTTSAIKPTSMINSKKSCTSRVE